jgi:hypothetical protein
MVTKDALEPEFAQLKQEFPDLILQMDGIQFQIDGCIDIVDDEGGYWDTYKIRILIPPDYPTNLPLLQEIGGKIERHEDWHNSTGFCCLSTNAIMFAELAGDISLLKWFKKFAYPFLANHVYKIRMGKYAYEEFSHGAMGICAMGILEGYRTLFKTQNTVEIIRRIKLLAGKGPGGRNDKCFCGSGKKLKYCYLRRPLTHTFQIPISVLENDLIEIVRLRTTGG